MIQILKSKMINQANCYQTLIAFVHSPSFREKIIYEVTVYWGIILGKLIYN